MRGGNFGTAPASKNAPAVVAPIGNDKGILAHELQTEIMGTVPTFGNTKVTVGFYGDNAFCSPEYKYVNVPQLPSGMVIPTRIAQEIRGFAMHEAAHLMFTDHEAWPGALTEEEKKNPLLKEIWNALEDYMIERNFLIVYPGAHKNFTATEARCCHKYLASYSNNPDMAKDLRIIGAVALTWARSIHFGLKTPLSADCMKTMPAGLQQRVWGWFNDAIDVETTSECIELARKIVADINANPFDPTDPPANPNHNPLANQSQGVNVQGSSQAGKGKGRAKGAAATGLAPQPGGGPGNAPQPYHVGHNLNDALQEAGVKEFEHDISFAIRSDTTEGPAATILADAQGTQVSVDLRAKLSSTIGLVASTIRRALQSMAKDKWKSGRADGRIDDKRLSGIILGQQEIYKKLIPAPEIDTAVSILIDCSGSMGGDEIALCQQLALVLQIAFSGTPIKFEILGYTSGDFDSLPDRAKIMAAAIKQQTGHDPALRSVQLYEFKGFQAHHHVALTTIGNMTKVPMGGTPTGDAILMAHERLSKRPERRHVMFVLTDGAPDDNDKCIEAVEAVERCGVTVLGIGIRSNAVKRAFRNWLVLSRAEDLSAAVLGTLSQMLFKDRFKIGLKPKSKSAHIVTA